MTTDLCPCDKWTIDERNTTVCHAQRRAQRLTGDLLADGAVAAGGVGFAYNAKEVV